MHAFCVQFVSIVEAYHMGLENYEVFLLETQNTFPCCLRTGLCSCNQFPLYAEFNAFFFHGLNVLAECCGVFSVYLKLEMCAVNLVVKVLLVKPMYSLCQNQHMQMSFSYSLPLRRTSITGHLKSCLRKSCNDTTAAHVVNVIRVNIQSINSYKHYLII